MTVARPLMLMLFVIASAWSADPARRLAVLFLGDQGHHKPAERFAWIKEPLAARGIDVTYTVKLEDLAPATLAKYDALLVYANIPQVSADQEKAILDYVASGKGFVPVHCASACFGKNPALVELIGGKFKSHKTDTFRAAIVNREHPTMQGYGSFETWDETYVHAQHNEVNRTVLMERVEGAVREPWTWIRTHGQGRIFYTASGHDGRTWHAPGFQDLLARGIAWSAGAIGEASLKELLGAFGKTNRAPLVYEERPTVQNYEKRTPAPQYQLPLSAKDSQDYIKTEHGFTATLFAAEPDVVKPIAFTWDHRGRLWVAESVDYPSKFTDLWQGNDRIKICEDTDGDGKADKFTIFADKLNIPTGLVFANGGLIVSQAPQFLFFKDTNGDDIADERRVLMEGWSKGDTHAGPSNLHYGFDNKIYGAVGYSGFKSAAKDVDNSFRSGLFRMRKNADQVEFISQFSNNTWGLGISETGEIFGSTANGTHHCYIPIPIPYLDGVVGLPDVGELKKAIKVDGHYAADELTEQIRQVDVFGGFTAAAGHNLYTARSFPAAYWNRAALVCEPTMHVLHQGFLKRDGSGWTEDGDGGNLFASSDQWVAPVHAEVGPDGSVWVADWYNFIIQHNPTPRKEHGGFDAKTGKGGAHENPLRDETHGRIYRVTWQGAKPGRKQIDVKNVDDLLAALTDDNLFWRLAAQRLLVERKNIDVVPRLITIAQDQAVDAVGLNGGVVQALWTLHGLGVMTESNAPALAVAIAALRHPSYGVRRNAVQVLPAILVSSQAIVVSGVLNDADSNVTLAALLAVSQLPASSEIGQALFTLSRNQLLMKDRYISNALMLAGARHGLGYLQEARRANVSFPSTNEVVNMGLQQVKNGDFEIIKDEMPINWRSNNSQGNAVFSVSKDGRKGNCVEISASDDGADAAWITDVSVKPNTRYRLSGWINTRDLKGAMGALLNIHGTDYKTVATNATRKWREVFVEFVTKAETSIQVNCLFGGGGKSTGTAWFDDVMLKELVDGSTVGLMERLIGQNIAMNLSIQEQVDVLTWLAAGDQGVMTLVAGGMANSWSLRDVPETITEAQRAALIALVTKSTGGSQESLGAIVARWSGKVAKTIKADDGPQLPPAEMKRYQSGQERYMTLCIACHQPNGQGLAGLAPSLVSSEWVQGPVSRPARIVLHGLQGPITVNKQPFTSPVVMPPQKDVLDDVAIAEVLTYVRNAWGNKAAPVQAADVTAIREQEKDRSVPWTAEELLKVK